SRYVMIACADGPEARAERLSALRKARERFLESDSSLSDTMRAKVAADLDKAIAEMEKSDR
ncbi:MAG TPA: peptidase M56, BlaR1, partial [Sphingopyxis sp.]